VRRDTITLMPRDDARTIDAVPQPDADFAVDTAILIAVGAHPRAERSDRPLAYRLRERMLAWLDAHAAVPDLAEPAAACRITVVSDIWLLNDEPLRARPTVSVGAPAVNALAAYLADKLEPAFVAEGAFAIQMDLDLADVVASVWGGSNASTAAAVDAFAERYLDLFMRTALQRVEI
jgi:hypothetical protein